MARPGHPRLFASGAWLGGLGAPAHTIPSNPSRCRGGGGGWWKSGGRQTLLTWRSGARSRRATWGVALDQPSPWVDWRVSPPTCSLVVALHGARSLCGPHLSPPPQTHLPATGPLSNREGEDVVFHTPMDTHTAVHMACHLPTRTHSYPNLHSLPYRMDKIAAQKPGDVREKLKPVALVQPAGRYRPGYRPSRAEVTNTLLSAAMKGNNNAHRGATPKRSKYPLLWWDGLLLHHTSF